MPVFPFTVLTEQAYAYNNSHRIIGLVLFLIPHSICVVQMFSLEYCFMLPATDVLFLQRNSDDPTTKEHSTQHVL
jgi:hypothetical protein